MRSAFAAGRLALCYLFCILILADAFISVQEQHSQSINRNAASAITSSMLLATQQQTFCVDGAEYMTLKRRLLAEGSDKISKWPGKGACLTLVTGDTKDGKTVLGVRADIENVTQDRPTTTLSDGKTSIYTDSLVVLDKKKNVSIRSAMRTYISAMTAVHCALPITGIGGSDEKMPTSVVVLGKNAHAVATANALARGLGATVTLVATERPQGLFSSIKHIPPGVDVELSQDQDDEDDDDTTTTTIPFASYLGKFDALIDTIGSEWDDDVVENSYSVSFRRKNLVLSTLSERHDCQFYVSTLTKSQEILASAGIWGGPGKASDHVKQVQQQSGKDYSVLPPPSQLGNTVQAILDAGIFYPDDNAMKPNSVYVRGWVLADVWEATTWPRDAGTSVRFGFLQQEEEDDEEEIQERVVGPGRIEAFLARAKSNLDSDEEEDVKSAPRLSLDDEEVEENPHVVSIRGIRGLQEQIVDPQQDCLLFLSASFCRTCRYLRPQYQRMARLNNDNFMFAEASAVGPEGKALGRALGIDAVPAFLLFRKGKRYGRTFSVSRLPDKKLDLALDYLKSGNEWDPKAFREEENKK